MTMALDAGVKYFLSLTFFFQNQTVSKASVTKLQLRNWASLFQVEKKLSVNFKSGIKDKKPKEKTNIKTNNQCQNIKA